jgi:pimeloyl-ACP methyl ester carboxylesterase
MKTIICNGIPVRYRTCLTKNESKNSITIICLHNAGTDHSIWSPIAEILSEKYTVIQLDWPGYGENRGEPKGHGLGDYADILFNFIEQCELKSVVLVGNCLGSGTALEYCIRSKGAGIHAMVLFNVLLPRTLGLDGEFFFRWSGSRFNKLYHKFRESLFVPGPLTGAVVRYQIKNPGKVSADIKEHLKKLNAAPANVRNLGLLIEALNKSTRLNSLKMLDYFPPTMVIWGDKNRVLPLQKGEKFVWNFGPSDFQVLNGGHLVMLEQPNESAAKIFEFIHQANRLNGNK